jgi:hypothetical protein
MVCSFTANGPNGLQILNYTFPATPEILANFSTGNAISVKTSRINNSSYAFVACADQGFYIVDVTNPSSPHNDTILNYSNDHALCSFIDTLTKRLYVGTFNGYMYIYNIATLPSAISLLGTYQATTDVNSIFVVNNLAYIAEGSVGMEILTVVNPAFPAFVSGFPSNNLFYNDVKTYLNYAYAAAGASLIIFDITNSNNPQYITSYQNGNSNFYSIAMNTSKVLNAEGRNGVEVVDFATPSTPLQIGFYKTNDFAADIFYYDGEIFVADGSDGLLLLRYIN